MEKTTRKLNDLLSQFLSLRNEVSEIADKTADAVFDSVESGDITKEEALTILTDNKLLPVANWGDINPATKKVEGDYGQKYTGCVSEKESLITPENGFRLIETLEAGMSPLSVVYQRDLEYEKLMNKSNEIQG